MKTFSKFLVALIILLLIVIIALLLDGETNGSSSEGITSFEECVAAGYPVQESYPERCATPDGRTFTRIIDNDAPEPVESEHTIQLYYYNPDLDTDSTGNILCSEKGLVAVDRDIPVTQTPIQDTIELLLQGDISSTEVSRGITTEFPLNGFELIGANLVDGTLTLEFADPNNTTTGGSCRTGILWQQIKNTALQFDEVNEVRFLPEELFQP